MAATGAGVRLRATQGLVRVSHANPDGLLASSFVCPGDAVPVVDGWAMRAGARAVRALCDGPERGPICCIV